MEEKSDNIMAVISLQNNKEKVGGGGVPFFFAEDKKEMEEISTLLARLTLGMIHDLGNGIRIIIKH